MSWCIDDWEHLRPGTVPVCLDQREYGPIWGRLKLDTLFGEFLFESRDRRRRFVFTVSSDGKVLYDRYKTRVARIVDVDHGDMEIAGAHVLDACRAARINAR